MKTRWVAGLLSAFAVGTVAQVPLAQAHMASRAKISGLVFFSSDAKRCANDPLARTTFVNATPYICIRASFIHWSGTHKVVLTISSPVGKYGSFSRRLKSRHKSFSWTTSLAVATDQAAELPGVWTVRLTLDGKQARSDDFTLLATPSPTSTPVPTSTPLPTSTSTPPPTSLPTYVPPPTLMPTNVPPPTAAPRLEYSGTSLIDTDTGVSASSQKLQYGQEDNYTLPPSPGAAFLWVLASETNRSSVPFVSSYFNFELQDKNSGVVYQLKNGTPYGATENIMPVLTLNSGQTNVGWMEASIPDVPATYYVMWNEDGAIPWTPIVHFDYRPGSFARTESAVTVRNTGGTTDSVFQIH